MFPKPVFQLLNLRAQGRLRKVQPQCGLPKMTLLRDRDEGKEMTKFRTVLHRRTAPYHSVGRGGGQPMLPHKLLEIREVLPEKLELGSSR